MFIPYTIISKKQADKLRGDEFQLGVVPGLQCTKLGIVVPPISLQILFDNVNSRVQKYMLEPKWKHEWQDYHEVDDVIAMSYATTTDYNPPHPEGLDYYPFQKAGIEYGAHNDGVLITDEMGCVTGDTIVTTEDGNQTTIKQLYETFQPNIKIQCFHEDTNQSGYNTVKKVIYKGYKNTFRITLQNGKQLQATLDHEILTSAGYTPIEDLVSHDKIMCVNPIEQVKFTNIQFNGAQDVYDIVMEDPYRNFVANGIVVHNCGKSIQAIGICNVRKHKTVVVVCPLSVKLHWIECFTKWLVYPVDKIIPVDSKTPSAMFLSSGVFVLNYDILTKLWGTTHRGPLQCLKHIDCIIFDESHNLRNYKAQRTKTALTISKVATQRILLTGTPIEKRPKDIYFQAKIANPNVFNNSVFFKHRYCDPKCDKWGNWTFDGASNSKELSWLLRGTIMVRREKSQVLQDLPTKIKTKILLSPDNKQKSLIKQFITIIKHYDSLDEDADIILNQMQKNKSYAEMRKQLGNSKVDSCIEFVEELLESVNKVVVFTYHRQVLEELVRNWGKRCVSIIGGDDDKHRQHAVKQFIHNDKVQVIIISILAGGIGLDGLQQVCNTAVFCELPFNPSTLEQAEDRLHRIGQNDNVNIYHLLVEKSCDTTLYRLLTIKQKRADKVLK